MTDPAPIPLAAPVIRTAPPWLMAVSVWKNSRDAPLGVTVLLDLHTFVTTLDSVREMGAVMGKTLRLVLLFWLLLASQAAAGPKTDIAIQSDSVVVGSPDLAASTLADWKARGVEYVRFNILWYKVAPPAQDGEAPRGFDDRNPNDGHYDWSAIDTGIARVRNAGLKVMLTIATPAPTWAAHRRQQAARSTHTRLLAQQSDAPPGEQYKPDAARFGNFAFAVAKRYRNEVDRYIIGNEPNFSSWLTPQWTCKSGTSRGCKPYAPHLYRKLVRATYPAIKRLDPTATVFIGALAQRGNLAGPGLRNMPPIEFLRAFGCVDRQYRPIRTGMCKGFKPAKADDLTVHYHGSPANPLTKKGGEFTIAHTAKLISTIDRLTKKRRLLRRGGGQFQLAFAEFGTQTTTNKKFFGVTQERQDSDYQLAGFLGWNSPRIRNVTFYLWVDEPNFETGWQTGWHTSDLTPKLALAHFNHPIWLAGKTLWGQVRPGTRHTVQVQQGNDENNWRTVKQLKTDRRGYWHAKLTTTSGSYRFTYNDSGSQFLSDTVTA